LVNNVEPDHLEHYGDFEGLVAAFERFLAEAPGPRVVCADDPIASRLGRIHDAMSFGQEPEADYRVQVAETGRHGTRFTLSREGGLLGEVALPVPGLHNALNAAGALVTAMTVSAPFEAGAAAFVDADDLIVTDVFPAGEAPRPGVTGRLIVRAVLDAHPSARVAYLPRRHEQVAYLERLLRPGDVCLTLGAGDLTPLPADLLEDLAS